MTDSLRTRIAAVLQSSWPAPWFDGGRQHQQVADLADAVIRELALRREHSPWIIYPNTFVQDRRLTRWVTEWTADD